MTAVMLAASPRSLASSKPPTPSHPPLTPLITSTPSTRRTAHGRPGSHRSRHRGSQYSAGSAPRSRPVSALFPSFPSTLPYALVRDFAYPPQHPLHYGPPLDPSQPSSAVDSQRRMSDPQTQSDSRMPWETWGNASDPDPNRPSTMQFMDGPPWSEDEDLHSPVVSQRHHKHKIPSSSFGNPKRSNTLAHPHHHQSVMDPQNYDQERDGYHVGPNIDGGKMSYPNRGGEGNGPDGEYVSFPPDKSSHDPNALASASYPLGIRQPRKLADAEGYLSGSDKSSPCSTSHDHQSDDASRWSLDYQFTITSPDEEMHGKAVALFDFKSENENELPLVEGQIIWVSYRHGQGWLVAKDPKTQENGLVPEAYVRLLRDIEGGMNSLTGTPGSTPASPLETGTPTQAEHNMALGGQTPTLTSVANGYPQPVVSTFSTSSKDLDLYPTNQLGIHIGLPPPDVVHYHGQPGGSQNSTPVLGFYHDSGILRRESVEYARRVSDTNSTPVLAGPKPSPGAVSDITLPAAHLELTMERTGVGR